ncbi:hypothetical protein HDU81_008112 [Chytriomyces hyalinus]|nr:hypothetical protein HDU81_008112 [Chytriomyces hyalinus]
MVFNTLSKAASELNVCIAGAIFFASYSILKRTNAVLFDEHPLAFSQDLSLAFGYSTEQVLRTANAISSSAVPLVVAASVANVAAILSYAFLGSAMISWACESLGTAGQGAKPINQFPVVNGAIHFVEAVLVTAALLTAASGDEFAALASVISNSRSVVAVVTLVLGAVATAQFLWVWCKSIGRDGRQKIEKQE